MRFLKRFRLRLCIHHHATQRAPTRGAAPRGTVPARPQPFAGHRQAAARRVGGAGGQRGAPRRTALNDPAAARPRAGPGAICGAASSEAAADSREQLDSERRLCFPAERHGGCAVRAAELFRELGRRQPSCPHCTAPGAAPAARGSPPFPGTGE